MVRHTRLFLMLGAVLIPTGAASQVVRPASLLTQQRPAPGTVLEQVAGLEVRDVPLLTALTELERRSGLALAYSPSLLPNPSVSCACRDSTVAGALRTLLARTGFTFRQAEQQVVLLLGPTVSPGSSPSRSAPVRPLPSEAPTLPPAVITGRILTEGQTPLAGALVTLASAGRSVLSNTDGRYRIVVPEGAVVQGADTLAVTLLGYNERRIPFTLQQGEIVLDVILTVDAVQLDEILVTGTAGNQARGAQAAVISRIDAADVVDVAPVSNVTQVLEGRVPGITITPGSGTTGAASRINIRGAASLSLSNQPLVFIDGIRMNSRQRELLDVGGQTLSALNDLNPSDIRRIEIVKGPAAATLYGADASAGVIQIFTKRGMAGAQGLTQTASLEYGLVEPNFTPRANYAACPAELTDPAAGHPLCAGLEPLAIVSDNPLARQGAFSDGYGTSFRYSARGGGDGYGYYASFGADDEDGTTRNNSLERRTGRVNFNWTANPDLTFDAAIGLSHNEVRLPPGDQFSYGYMIGAGLGSPLTVRTAQDGTLAGGWLFGNESVESLSGILSKVTTKRATPSVRLQYSPTAWFTNRLTLGGDISQSTALQFFPKNDRGWYSGDQANGWVQSVRSNTDLYTVDYLGNIRTTFGEDDQFSSDLSFGSQFISRTTGSSWPRASG